MAADARAHAREGWRSSCDERVPAPRHLRQRTEARVNALAAFGFTQRQREFLVTAMVHSGCFLERQYCAFTGTVHGQNSREFMARLAARGFARVLSRGRSGADGCTTFTTSRSTKRSVRRTTAIGGCARSDGWSSG